MGPHAGTRTSAPAPASRCTSACIPHRRELRRAGALRRPSPAVLRAAPRTAARRRIAGVQGGPCLGAPKPTPFPKFVRDRAAPPLCVVVRGWTFVGVVVAGTIVRTAVHAP